jgi:hypothetical protein
MERARMEALRAEQAIEAEAARSAAAAHLEAAQAEAEAARAALRERLDAVDAGRHEHAARHAAVATGLRDVIECAVRKEVRFEADRARKAAQTPEKLRAWLESFYASREDAFVQNLLPSMRLHYVLIGRADEAEAETRRLAAAYIEESRVALEVVLGAENLEAAVRALTTAWETVRPKKMADDLLREVIADV